MLLDLTISLNDGLKMLAAFPAVSISNFFDYDTTESRYLSPCEGCKVEHISLVTHIGTHADAPAHFVRGGETMDAFDLGHYMGDAVLIDLSNRPDDVPVSATMLAQALEAAEVKGAGNILLLRLTRKRWNDPGFLDVKALTEDAARVVLDYGFKCVGIDLMCVDCLEDMRRPVHMCLLGNGVAIVEGLDNMDKIPRKDCWFCALPLKLVGAGGSPVRAVCKF